MEIYLPNCVRLCRRDQLKLSTRRTTIGMEFTMNCRSLKSSKGKPSSQIKIKAEKKPVLKENNLILCRNCGNTITSIENMITVNDRHKHTFINPAGYTYQIGCFSAADGCIVYGDPTPEHSWFNGFSWNYAICSQCINHIGWYYQGRNESFFGLILDRLVETTATH